MRVKHPAADVPKQGLFNDMGVIYLKTCNP